MPSFPNDFAYAKSSAAGCRSDSPTVPCPVTSVPSQPFEARSPLQFSCLQQNHPLILGYFVPGDAMLHHLISRCGVTIMYIMSGVLASRPCHHLVNVALIARLVALLFIGRLEQLILLCTLISERLGHERVPSRHHQ